MDPSELPQDFKEFFEFLNSEAVEYLLVGGFAVGLHGYVRSTGDIDTWVNPTIENAEKVASALRRFGFDSATIPTEKLSQPNCVLQMGVPPMRIDVLTSVSGLEFDEAFSNRDSALLGDVPVHLISLTDLKTNKRASGRNKDLADLDHLPD